MKLGKVKHYFSKIGVAIIVCQEADLALGETIHVKGSKTDIVLKVGSLRVERKPATVVSVGKEAAVKVPGKVRMDDTVYKVDTRQ